MSEPSFGPFSVPCQRCGKRAAVQLRIENRRGSWLFGAATDRSSDQVRLYQVRLCNGCLTTVESLGARIAKAKTR